MRKHSGGFDPLSKVPPFKYTQNEERKMFIGHMYPYADYLINIIQQIKTDSYRYEGECWYQTIGKPTTLNYNGKTTDQSIINPEIQTFHLKINNRVNNLLKITII